MSDKNFKVKSGLNIPITSAAILTTDSTGNISSQSVLPISAGGTGQTTATNAINALLPVQNGSTVNYVIQSDGVNINWGKLYNQTIKDTGTTVTPRGNINFIGATITDNLLTDTTTISFPLNTYLRQSFTPTAGQTSFTLNAGSIEGAEQVYLNGILLVRNQDYTTPDATTILLSTGASVGDSLDVMTLNSLTTSGILSNYKQEINFSISSNTTLVTGYRYFVDTTAARTLTLPANPTLGGEISIFDASGSANTYNITVSRNGNLINGSAGNLIIDTDGGWYTLVYTGATYGWKVG